MLRPTRTTPDAYTSLQGALNAAAEAHDLVLLDAGVWGLSKGVSVPHGVSLVSIHSYTTLRAIAPMPFMVQYDTTHPFGNRYGHTEGIELDGAGMAERGFDVASAVQRTWKRCKVTGCTDAAIVLRGTQNCTFERFDAEHNPGSGMRLNWGAGNNEFRSCELNQNGVVNLDIVEDHDADASPGLSDAVFSAPSHNEFYKVVIERTQAGTFAAVRVRAGIDNGFNACNFHTDGARPVIDADGGALTRFTGCGFNGATTATAFKLRNHYRPRIRDCTLESFAVAYDRDETSKPFVDDGNHYAGIGTMLEMV